MKSASNWLKGLDKANHLHCSIFSSSGHFVHGSGTVLAVMVEGNPRNILVKFE